MALKLAVLWLNYNGRHLGKVLKLSLESIGKLASRLSRIGVEVTAVVVDNHSTDGSDSLIRAWVSELSRRYLATYTFVRTGRNWGYSGGMNIAYRLAGNADLIMPMNNDVVINPEGATKLVECALRAGHRVGGVQGIILKPVRDIDNAGGFIDELLATRSLKELIKTPTPVTYLSGAISILRSEALRLSGMGRRLFVEAIPAYFDDVLIGIRLWRNRFFCVSLPVVAGFHLHSATFAKYSAFKLMNSVASHVALTKVVRSRYEALVKIFTIKLLARMLYKARIMKPGALKDLMAGVKLGKAVGSYLASKEGVVDIEAMPYIRLSAAEALKETFLKIKLGDILRSSLIAVGRLTLGKVHSG